MLIVGWHGACIVLGNVGCFVTWEFEEVAENVPPEWKSTPVASGDPVIVTADRNLSAAARDQDAVEGQDDPVVFLWTAAGERQEDTLTPDGNGIGRAHV